MPQLRHRVGELIRNRYEVRKELGAGGFGVVYGCRDAELGIVAAVKELHVVGEGEERERALSQFRAEAIHLSKLRHRHIVSGHYERDDAGGWRVCPLCGFDFPHQTRCPDHGAALLQVESRHYLVMEYIAGPDLLSLLEDFGGMLPPEKIEHYALQLADALSFIHSKSLVHRDIKPENVRLRRVEDEIVLLDFGIATQGQEQGAGYGTRVLRHTSGGGTMGYAPDNPAERRQPDARSDVHAFGMTLYHLATALDPTHPADLRQMRAHGPRNFRPELSAKLESLILDCMEVEPDRRPQSGADLKNRLLQGEALPFVSAPSSPPNFSPVNAARVAPPAPTRALLFRSGHAVSQAGELAYMCDHAPREVEKKLFSGEVEQFLGEMGEDELARAAAQIRVRDAARRAQGVENLAQKLGMARPEIEFSPAQIDFGTLAPDGQSQREVRVQNRGRGLLFGLIRASHPAVATFGEWQGNREKIPVSFHAAKMAAGEYRGEIELQSSAGRVTLPFRAWVRGPSPWPAFWSVTLSGIFGALAGVILRFSPRNGPMLGALESYLGTQTVRQIEQGIAFGGALWLILGVWALGEAIARRSCLLPILWLFPGTAFCAYSTFVSAGWIAAGDLALRPLASMLGPGPEAGWLLGGALCGVAYGLIRRPKYWLAGRAIGLLGGVFTLAAVVTLALWSAKQ